MATSGRLKVGCIFGAPIYLRYTDVECKLRLQIDPARPHILFFELRNPDDTNAALRDGFVVLDPPEATAKL